MRQQQIALSALLATSLTLASSCALAPARLTGTVPVMSTSNNDEIIVEQDEAIVKGRQVGYIKLHVKWPELASRKVQAFPASTEQFRLTVTADDLPQPIMATISRETDASTASVQLTVPAGTGRALKVEGLNASLKVVASATKPGLSVNQGEFTPVTMGLINTVGDLAGTVIDQVSKLPIAGVEVIGGVAFAVTDGSGKFELHDLDPGTQTLTYKKAGYEDGSHSLSVMAGAKATAGTTGLSRKHWIEWGSSTSEQLFGVTTLSPSDLWIYGENQTILGSMDGGFTWKRPTLPGASGAVYGVKFATPAVGYAVTLNGLYKTENAGDTWRLASAEMGGTGLGVVDSQTVISFANGTIGTSIVNTAISEDSGTTNTVNQGTSGVWGWVGGWNVLSRNTFFAYGYLDHTIVRTSSGGLAWQIVDISPMRWEGGSPNCTYSSDGIDIYLAGYKKEGDLYRRAITLSQSGGADWSEVFASATSSTPIAYRAITKIGGTIYAVGTHGRIAQKPAGSSTWTEATVQSSNPNSIHLNAVAFADANTGWAVGDNGKLVKY